MHHDEAPCIWQPANVLRGGQRRCSLRDWTPKVDQRLWPQTGLLRCFLSSPVNRPPPDSMGGRGGARREGPLWLLVGVSCLDGCTRVSAGLAGLQQRVAHLTANSGLMKAPHECSLS